MSGMSLRVEVNEKKLRELVLRYLAEEVAADIKLEEIQIQVKSKQNYKSEWEEAAFKAVVVHHE